MTTEDEGTRLPQKPISFSAVRWGQSLGEWWPEDAPGNDRISRDDLFRVADQWRSGARPASDLFVLTMAWGYGNVGYGRHRTKVVLAADGVREKLERSLKPLSVSQLASPAQLRSAYTSLSWGGANRLRGLGPAFFTKLLYFAGFRHGHAGVQPLILDARVARALPAAGGPRLPVWGWSSDQWLMYLAWASERAAGRNVPADVVELELFQAGARRR